MASIKTIFTNIANAIRTKKGTSAKYLPENMAEEISTIDVGITPSGKIEITNTEEINVTNYETAQVVDSNLSAENIKKDISILGVTGTLEGGGDTTQEDGLITREGTYYTNDRVTKVGDHVFSYSSNLVSISFPNATSIGISTFSYCSNLSNVSFPKVTNIGKAAFYGCSGLTSVSLPKLTQVGENVFWNCTGLTNVSFPNATIIDYNAFYGCSGLTDVSCPNVTSISNVAFYKCPRLTKVSLPKVTTIGNQAFYQCYSLIKLVITQADSVCTLGSEAFYSCYHILGTTNTTYNPTGAKDGYIYVPDTLVSSYKTATNWKTYASQIKPLSDLYIWEAASESFSASMTVGFNVNGQTYFGTTETYSIDLGPGAKNISLSSNTNTAFVSNLADYSYNSTTGILTINKLYNQYPTTATITINYNKRKLDI